MAVLAAGLVVISSQGSVRPFRIERRDIGMASKDIPLPEVLGFRKRGWLPVTRRGPPRFLYLFWSIGMARIGLFDLVSSSL